MQLHHVRVHRSEENLAREDQLVWKIAGVAADPVDVTEEVADVRWTRRRSAVAS